MSMDKIFESIGQNIIGPILIGSSGAAILFFREWFKSKKKPYSIRISAEKNDKIQDVLLEIRLRLNADRAYVSMFHNGNKYIEGSEILKKSRTNESAGPGISFEAQHYQNILISLMPDEMKLVTQAGPSFTKVDDLQDGKFKRMLVRSGIKCTARCAISRNKDIIGFVGLDYNRDLEKPPENINELCNAAGIIEQIIADYDR